MRYKWFLWLLWLCYPACVWAEIQPEVGSGFRVSGMRSGQQFMAVTAHPRATAEAVKILEAGGTAVDAAIAAQMVLNVVEPQSSGIGGGGFLLYYDAASGKLTSFDGRETAPAQVKADMFLREDGTPMPFMEAAKCGRSVGVPGLLAMLKPVHERYGALPWARLFDEAIEIARVGFPVSPRLHTLIRESYHDNLSADYKKIFLTYEGKPRLTGDVMKNPILADSFSMIAQGGVTPFYHGKLAEEMVEAVAKDTRYPGTMTMSDLAGYRMKERKAVCAPYHHYKICSMGPPSSGGITLLQMLGMLENFDIGNMAAWSSEALHIMMEVSKLAFADRNYYLADSDFVPVPTNRLLEERYLKRRAALVKAEALAPKAKPGNLGMELGDIPQSYEPASTTHISIVDKAGNAVAMTSSIEHAFGSGVMAGGFLLNNELTDFDFQPSQHGKEVANRVQSGKRPRSSMTPVMVFDEEGKLVLVIGSPGGSRIIGYVLKTLVAVLDWQLPLDEAINSPHVLNRNGVTEVEKRAQHSGFISGLQAKGHLVDVLPMVSGLHAVQIKDSQLYGMADMRREGLAIGE